MEFCPECESLLKAAQQATRRHIHAVSRLQIARIEGEQELAAALLAVMREASETRERVTTEYQVHRFHHRPALVPVTSQGPIPDAEFKKQNTLELVY